MSSTIDFGIDLGTTNSAIAHYAKGEVVVYKNPISLKETLPSVVAFKNDRTIVGDKARELLQKSKNNVFGLFKRKMGTADKYAIADTGKSISPIELSSLVLKELKNFIHSDLQAQSVVITIPSAFDTMQSNATKKAGYQAGFNEVVLLQEPIAASLAYANKSNLDITDGKWLVYDLGGGTFDVALTSIDDGELKIIDHEGDNFLGGTDFDKAIIDKFIIPKLNEKGKFVDLELQLKSSTGKYNRLFYKLLFLAEEAKKVLTNGDVAEIEFEITDETGKELDIYLELTKNEFENIIEPFVDKTIELIDNIIQRNQLSNSDLKCILMIGGSTYIPLVRNKLNTKYRIEINTSLDPTTAVVIGAAYYGGLKPKTVKVENTASRSNGFNSNTSKNSPSFKFAYERTVRESNAIFLAVGSNYADDNQYRINRQDGGFDSGMLPMKKQISATLPLVANAHNVFEFNLFDNNSNKLFTDKINITQGKFSIDGQPLPNNICLEIDSIENRTTFLEPIFKKNDILPLRKVITKQVSNTIQKGSNETIAIKVFEGDIDSIPAANKLIGMISINGTQLDRDLIKGTDIELTLEITESRDLKVGAYFTLTDQEFENTFSPSESNITKAILINELDDFELNLQKKLSQFEQEQKFEGAANILLLVEEIRALKTEANNVVENHASDDFYVLDVKKRDLAKKIQTLFDASLLTKAIEKYYETKRNVSSYLDDPNATDHDRTEYNNILSDEQKLLQSGNVTSINMKINHLNNIAKRIARKTPVTPQDFLMYFVFLKMKQYPARNKAAADQLINRGDQVVEAKNYIELGNIVNALGKLLEDGDDTLFQSKGTGLK